MAVLGLLIVLATAAFTADIAVTNADLTINGAVFGQSVPAMTPGGVFVAGAVTAIIFALGVAIMVAGMGRLGRRRRQRRDIATQQAEAQALREHNRRLEQELEARHGRTAYPEGAEPGVASDTTVVGPGGGRHAG